MAARLKICSRCKAAPKRSGGVWCLGCHAAYLRAWRAANPEPPHSKLDPVERLKRNARKRVLMRITRGSMKRLPCEVCGEPKSESHHPDYSKPLDVVFLCKRHHRQADVRDHPDPEAERARLLDFIRSQGGAQLPKPESRPKRKPFTRDLDRIARAQAVE